MENFLQLGVTQTLLKTFQTCKQKALYQLQGWKSKEPEWQMYFGTLFHGALESYYKDPSIALPQLLENAKKQIYSDSTYCTTSAYDVEEYVGVLGVLLRNYIFKYKDKDNKKKWLSIEESFDVTIHGVTYRGKADRIAQESDGIWLYDTKTKGYADIDEIKLWLPHDFQMHAYASALSGKYKFQGFVYDIVKVPSLKRKWGEELQQYLERVEDEVSKKSDLYFVRLRVRMRPELFKEAEENFGQVLGDYIDWNNSNNIPTKNKQACFYYGKQCPFWEACFQNNYSKLRHGSPFEELDSGTRTTNGEEQTKDKS